MTTPLDVLGSNSDPQQAENRHHRKGEATIHPRLGHWEVPAYSIMDMPFMDIHEQDIPNSESDSDTELTRLETKKTRNKRRHQENR